jgi:hypothetical protein
MWSSVPVDKIVPDTTDPGLVSWQPTDHALLEWYNPRPEANTAAKEHDFDPSLRDEEGGDNHHPVLEWNVGPPAGEVSVGGEDWTGLTQSISITGADLSKARYVEIWVNDFTPSHGNTRALLHLDLGRVSEDAYWDRTREPNRILDSEDKNGDRRLDGGDPLGPNFEDTGFDGVVSSLEPGYNAATNSDPSGDDYRYNVRDNPDDYSTINNLELNGIGSVNAGPDTEDLDLNGVLDLENDYYEATIDLSDDRYVATDVPRDYAGDPGVRPDNGWRLFRVPVSDEAFRAVGTPSWERVKHLRIWLSDLSQTLKLQIGGISIEGFPPPAVDKIVLDQNQPNPFNPHTTIPYVLERNGRVRLVVYDIQGRLVRVLVDALQPAGQHSAIWSGIDRAGRAAPSGVYVYEIRAAGKRVARRMVLVR